HSPAAASISALVRETSPTDRAWSGAVWQPLSASAASMARPANPRRRRMADTLSLPAGSPDTGAATPAAPSPWPSPAYPAESAGAGSPLTVLSSSAHQSRSARSRSGSPPTRLVIGRGTEICSTVALYTVAVEFDRIHSIQRAQQVGSVDAIIRPEELRPQIIAAVERGLAKC